MEICGASCATCALPLLDQNESVLTEKFGTHEFAQVTPKELCIGYSTIAGAGLGIFARSCIAKNTRIGDYIGLIIPEENLTENRYLWDLQGIANGYVIDAADPKYSNFTRFINHNKSGKRNLRAVGHFPGGIPTVTFVTTKNIKAQKELFVDYGEEYNAVLRKEGFTSTTDKLPGKGKLCCFPANVP